MRLLMNILPW